jgi:hypothetical protein
MRDMRTILKAAWPAPEVFAPEPVRVERVFVIAQVFYACLLFFACQGFVGSLNLAAANRMEPLWPLYWMRWSGQESGAIAAQLLYLCGPLLALWKPDSRVARVLAFVGCLTGMAFDNSFGKVNHHLHLWAMTAFLLVFLPSRRDALRVPAAGEAALRVFWGAQAAILLTYTMSGVAKLLGAAVQVLRGDASTLFSYDALARHTAERLLMTHETSLLGAWVINHPLWGAPAFWGAVYLEVFALAAAYRLSLHRLWALGLVLMHIGIFLTMNVTFSHSILLLGLMFAASPFATSPFTALVSTAPVMSTSGETGSRSRWNFEVGGFLRDLPLFGPFVKALPVRRRARPDAEPGTDAGP